MDSSANIERLFLNLLEGSRMTEEELHSLHDWLVTHPEEAAKYSDFREIWALASMPEEEAEKEREAEYQRLERRIMADNRPVVQMEQANRFRIPILAAAVIAGILIAFAALRLWDNRNIQKDKYIVDVPAGSRSSVILPDGTRVTLNGASGISYNPGYGRRNRDVYLSGEGYFEVRHGAPHTFSVHAGGTVVSAHGTVFNVKAYPDDPCVEATLVNGSISITLPGNSDEKIFLKPSEQFTWLRAAMSDASDNGSVLISKGIDTERYTSWISGRLIVQSESLADLSLKLERKYDVEITFAEPDLRNLRFTGVLEDETIEQVLEVLKVTSNLDFTISGRDIILFSGRKKP